MADGACRICLGKSGRAFSANGFAWFHCSRCGAVQKVLTHRQYLDLNPTYDPGEYLDSASREHIEQFLRVDHTTKVLDRIVRQQAKKSLPSNEPRTFLDVGCGMGSYLLAARRLGFDVVGFEPSADHAHVATKHLHLPVIADYFSLERVADRKFDLIMLSHVIEHIYAPGQFLHDLLSVLKPGGTLIVITPNSDSVVAWLTGRLWPMLKPVDHVTMMCAKTYSFFGLDELADIEHRRSEYAYEFAATFAAVMKAKIKQRSAAKIGTVRRAGFISPPPLRRLGRGALMLKWALTVASAPWWLLAVATRKQACLTSILVRKAIAH
jgi:2-polyprenyl-3-methyl-5-hydroxy-6-metoxy-1,4-benzoquinol methylase